MTLRSMTGYGASSCSANGVSLSIEMKSVNHRGLDLHMRMPKLYGEFESSIRELLFDRIARGRVEVSVLRQTSAETSGFKVRVNDSLFSEFVWATQSTALRHFGSALSEEQLALHLFERREVVEIEEVLVDGASEKELLESGVKEAAIRLQESREREGKRLETDICGRIETISATISKVEETASLAVGEASKRLKERLDRIVANEKLTLDPGRLEQEVAVLAERTDITEELVRLKSHVIFFGKTLAEKSSGRKLDFICQEISRELNTINAKTISAETKALGVALRSELEKVREQLQNIE